MGELRHRRLPGERSFNSRIAFIDGQAYCAFTTLQTRTVRVL